MPDHVHTGALSMIVFLAQFILASAALKLAAAWLSPRTSTAGDALGAIVA